MAIPLSVVKASNASLRKLGPGLVALFVGGTSGLGESTLRALARNTSGAKIYIVGRNGEAAEKIKSEVDADVEFLKADVSLLGEVDRVCDIIGKKEATINIMVLSAGYLSFQGRNESPEGLDRKLSVHYYSRMRFITNLLSQLRAASTAQPPKLSRVISILGTGEEDKLILDDLDLKTHFSLRNCVRHSVTMTSLALEAFAKKEPTISFVHSYPGVVMTNVGRNFGTLVNHGLKFLFIFIKPWTVNLVESGERHLYDVTAAAYPPACARDIGVVVAAADAQEGVEIAKGSDGTAGSGAYLLNWDGKVQSQSLGLMKEYREGGVQRKVWEHTMEMFEKIEKQNGVEGAA